MLTILERLGFAGWFGAAIWFSAFGTSALFGQLGVAGAAAALDVLFASLFWFCVGCGALATVGALGSRSPLRIALAALVLAAGLFLSLVVEPWFAQPGMFAAAHTTSFAVAVVAWLAAAAGLIAQRR
ncbi:MAG TPA: DUF4149 domain-containing protein [Bacillota bacterium]|nr:DUF4149 domain-containing protein [Bacillota bacterium]